MSVFKIIDYRCGSEPHTVELDVELRSGVLSVGERLVCYDTHHPVPYTVRAVHPGPKGTTLVCSGEFCYEEAFIDAVVDTAASSRPAAFHYEHRTTPEP